MIDPQVILDVFIGALESFLADAALMGVMRAGDGRRNMYFLIPKVFVLGISTIEYGRAGRAEEEVVIPTQVAVVINISFPLELQTFGRRHQGLLFAKVYIVSWVLNGPRFSCCPGQLLS